MIMFDEYIYTQQRAGGISKYWSSLHRAFQGLDLECRYIRPSGCEGNIFYEEKFPGNEMRKEISSFQRIYGCDIGSGDVDVFHSSYYLFPNRPVGKVVTTVHDFIYQKYDRRIRSLYFKKLFDRAIHRSTDVVCVSHSTRSDFIEYYPAFPKNKLHVIPNGVDDIYFDERITERHSVNDLGKYFLYVGSRGTCKNFEGVLELASCDYAMDNGIGLVLVSGADYSPTELKNYTRYRAFERAVQLQHVDNETLNKLYRSCVALLMPSFYEGFGIPAAEAAAAGCLVLGANTSSLPGVLGTNNFLFSPDDMNAGEEKVNRLDDSSLVADTISLQSESVAGLRWSSIARQYYDVYES